MPRHEQKDGQFILTDETMPQEVLRTLSMDKHPYLLSGVSRGAGAIKKLSYAAFASVIIFVAFPVVGKISVTKIKNGAPWIAYPVGHSIGPPFQFRIDASNSSRWAATHDGNAEDFILRLDDQTLIPHELYTAQEDRYQQWFRRFYPQLADVYDTGGYLDSAFLARTVEEPIDVDQRFHLAHCVLALRRYWDAKEGGAHVCSRDLDPSHIEHCLNVLDDWFFTDSGRAPVYLTWITQVCEYKGTA